MTIGENIKLIRKGRNLTQKELASKVGLSVTSIQNYEYGKFRPKTEHFEKIAAALEVTPFDLIGYEYRDQTIDIDQVLRHRYGDDFSVFEDYMRLNGLGKQIVSGLIKGLIEAEWTLK